MLLLVVTGEAPYAAMLPLTMPRDVYFSLMMSIDMLSADSGYAAMLTPLISCYATLLR